MTSRLAKALTLGATASLFMTILAIDAPAARRKPARSQPSVVVSRVVDGINLTTTTNGPKAGPVTTQRFPRRSIPGIAGTLVRSTAVLRTTTTRVPTTTIPPEIDVDPVTTQHHTLATPGG